MVSVNAVFKDGESCVCEFSEIPKVGSHVDILNNKHIVNDVRPPTTEGVECDIHVSVASAPNRFAFSINAGRY